MADTIGAHSWSVKPDPDGGWLAMKCATIAGRPSEKSVYGAVFK